MSVASEALRSYLERIELICAEQKELADDKSAVFAEAKANGFLPVAIRFLLKKRKMTPTERSEAEALEDTYLAAAGMARETNITATVDNMGIDITSREAVTEALKKFCPSNGAIEFEMRGARFRLQRDGEGNVTVEDITGRVTPPATEAKAPPRPRAEPPAVDSDGAEELGRAAFRANQAIVTNPFPFGDERRARWDNGWRDESGGDGMGD